MDISKYVEILSSEKRSWFSSKDNLEERLAALANILEKGSPSTIHSLIPYLKDKNKRVQNATCNTIIGLFSKIDSKRGYYDALKHCDISLSDIDFYENAFTKNQFTQLLSIASLNWSGYVREKAVQKLSVSRDEKAIQFIIYRLADWVPEVRQTALRGIEIFKKPENLEAFLENLQIFEWLQKVERTDLSSVYNRLLDFILNQNREYVHRNFTLIQDKSRLLLARHISHSADTDLNDRKLLLNDKHFFIRNLALDHFDKLSATEINRLLSDRSSTVRLNLLRKLQTRHDFIELIRSFLADDGVSIREFARYSLKNEVADFAAIYNDNLIQNRKIFGSICGLGETGGKQFSWSLERFLTDGTIRLRKAAFIALTKLDEATAFRFAIANLDSEFAGIRNVAIRFLQTKANLEMLEKARQIYQNGNGEIRKAMLKMFGRIGGWTTLADIMLGTIDENEGIRNLSVEYLQRWRQNAARLFIQPKPHERERTRQVLNFAFTVHEDKRYFAQNPLNGIDFYLR